MITKYATAISFFRKMNCFRFIAPFKTLKEMVFRMLLHGGDIEVCENGLCPTIVVRHKNSVIELMKVEDSHGNVNFLQAVVYQTWGKNPMIKEKSYWKFIQDNHVVVVKRQTLQNKADLDTQSLQVFQDSAKIEYDGARVIAKEISSMDSVGIDVDFSFFQSDYITKLEKVVGIEIAHQLRATKYPQMPMKYTKKSDL